ncbi:MAG TPA: response regulator [Bryobacteraceae bacterium]|nr:response regulator [Bryobacteraceae bacterium]
MTSKPILLVEDTPDDAELTVMSLKQSGLLNEVVVAEDGLEALDYLFGQGRYSGRNPQDTPALILLDIKMPKLDGIEVLQRLRADARTKVLPVVILTTSTEDIDLVRAYESGANAYVRKPVSLAQFQDAVRQLGLFWILTNEPPRGPR